MAHVPDFLLVHTVQVEDYVGDGARGRIYAPRPTPDKCFRSDKRQLVRDAQGRRPDAVSESVLTMPLGAGPVPGSRVDVGGGDWRTVLSLSRNDDGSMGAWQHDAVALT